MNVIAILLIAVIGAMTEPDITPVNGQVTTCKFGEGCARSWFETNAHLLGRYNKPVKTPEKLSFDFPRCTILAWSVRVASNEGNSLKVF